MLGNNYYPPCIPRYNIIHKRKGRQFPSKVFWRTPTNQPTNHPLTLIYPYFNFCLLWYYLFLFLLCQKGKLFASTIEERQRNKEDYIPSTMNNSTRLTLQVTTKSFATCENFTFHAQLTITLCYTSRLPAICSNLFIPPTPLDPQTLFILNFSKGSTQNHDKKMGNKISVSTVLHLSDKIIKTTQICCPFQGDR